MFPLGVVAVIFIIISFIISIIFIIIIIIITNNNIIIISVLKWSRANVITYLETMDWQLPDIVKTITNNILPSILSAHTVSIWRFHSVSIGRFRQCINRLFRLFPLISIMVGSRSPRYAMICT